MRTLRYRRRRSSKAYKFLFLKCFESSILRPELTILFGFRSLAALSRIRGNPIPVCTLPSVARMCSRSSFLRNSSLTAPPIVVQSFAVPSEPLLNCTAHRVAFVSTALPQRLGYKVFVVSRQQKPRQKTVTPLPIVSRVPYIFFVMPFALLLPPQSWLYFSSGPFHSAALRVISRMKTAIYSLCSPAHSLRLRGNSAIFYFPLPGAGAEISARVVALPRSSLLAT